MFSVILDLIESWVRMFVAWFTNFLPVKVIRDDDGRPFLYRYHLFALTNDGPGMCIHRFVKSDPDRGYHDHPWKRSMSFILSGGYEERVLNLTDRKSYQTYQRNRFTFNYLKGENNFHRVMLEEGKDAWTIFMFAKRNKTWGMIDLDGNYNSMSTKVMDTDGGWWNTAGTGYGVNNHIVHTGKVVATVDIVVLADSKVLLIKRGKDPYKDCWAFPGGRVEQKDNDLKEAARRELMEETSLDVPMEFVKTVGNNTRDPRGFCITNVFVAKLDTVPDGVKAGDDAVDYKWFSLDDLPEMAFDHMEILRSIL